MTVAIHDDGSLEALAQRVTTFLDTTEQPVQRAELVRRLPRNDRAKIVLDVLVTGGYVVETGKGLTVRRIYVDPHGDY